MTRRTALGLSVIAFLGTVALLAAGCSSTTVVERVTQIVVMTPEVPEVTRLVTVEATRLVTAEVTVVVTRTERDIVVVTATPIPPPDRLSEAAAYQAALRWIINHQRNNGGFGSAKETAWAVLALRAADIDPTTIVTASGRTPLDYLDRLIADNLVVGAETIALVTLALDASGQAVPEALGVAAPPYPTAWPAAPLTMIALGHTSDRAGGHEVWVTLIDALDAGLESAEETAWAIMALVSGGHGAEAKPRIASALDDLRAWQGRDDQWGDAFTSALALQALAAAGEDTLDWGQPARGLLHLQQDDGSFGDMVATAAAVIALQEAWLGKLGAS